MSVIINEWIVCVIFSWNEWLTLPVKFSDLPRHAQLTLTVWDIYGPRGVRPVGGTTISVFSKYGLVNLAVNYCNDYFVFFLCVKHVLILSVCYLALCARACMIWGCGLMWKVMGRVFLQLQAHLVANRMRWVACQRWDTQMHNLVTQLHIDRKCY